MTEVNDLTGLLATLVSQGNEHTKLLQSIDSKLDDVVQGLATVADGLIG